MFAAMRPALKIGAVIPPTSERVSAPLSVSASSSSASRPSVPDSRKLG